MARVFPVPAPASTQTGPCNAVATVRCSGSSAARIASADADGVRSVTDGHIREEAPPRTRLDQDGATIDSGPDKLRTNLEKMELTVSAFTMYSTPWCGYCHRLKGQLDRAGIPYTEIVEQVNNGNQTVPTVVFADGTAMTNPSLVQIAEKLAA